MRRVILEVPNGQVSDLVKFAATLQARVIFVGQDPAEYNAVLDLPVAEWEFPDVHFYRTHARAIIRHGGFRTIEDICRCTEQKFRKLKGAGSNSRTVDFIIATLAKLGLRLGMNNDDIRAFREGHFKL